MISINYSYINRDAKMKSRKCEICNVDVHRASYVKHLKSRKHLENVKQNEMIIPDWLFEGLIENKNEKSYNPKPLKQIARENFKIDDKQLNKELAKKMVNPYYVTDKALRVGFKLVLESHHNNHVYSELFIKPIYSEFGIEFQYFNKVVKELCVIYARLINQYNFKYQTVLPAIFDK